MHPAAFSVLLHRALEARIGRLMELTAVETWKQDPAGLHDVRVASRRVRAVMELVEPTTYPHFNRHLRRLKAVTRILGDPRELDVHLEILETLKAQTQDPLALAALEYTQETLDRPRRRARQRMERHLEKSSLEDCPRLLRVPSLGPLLARTYAQGEGRDSAWACLEPRLAPTLELLSAAPVQEDATALHALRIRIKKLRYTLEILAPALEGESEPVLEHLRGLQTHLGAHHDLATLEAHLWSLHRGLAERHRDGLATGLIDLLGRVAERRRTAFETFCELVPRFTPAAFRAHLRSEASA